MLLVKVASANIQKLFDIAYSTIARGQLMKSKMMVVFFRPSLSVITPLINAKTVPTIKPSEIR